jgi:hypothetical protein
MTVKHISSGKLYACAKIGDSTYQIAGKEVSEEDFKSKFEVVPDAPKPKVESKTKQVATIISGETDIGGNIGALAGALAKCQGEFTAVKKGTEGHGYSYADIEAVLSNSSPITSKYGIALSQMNISKTDGTVLLIGVKTILMHEDGGYISSEIFVPAMKTKMNSLVQMAGVNITYLRRYGIQSALGLATTDNDGRDD